MRNDKGLKKLLAAELQRSIWLYAMHLDTEDGDFEGAMCSQFHYLYWVDECKKLLQKHGAEHLEFWLRARGLA